MTSKHWGISAPIVTASLVGISVVAVNPGAPIKYGILAGLMLALAQSFGSTLALQWAWSRSFFYWVWGGGIFVRLCVLGATAFIVYRSTGISLVATLVTMVSATTLFLVIESATFFK